MSDIYFIQFYGRTQNSGPMWNANSGASFSKWDLGNGFSDTYSYCKNKGDFLWVNHINSLEEIDVQKNTKRNIQVYPSHKLKDKDDYNFDNMEYQDQENITSAVDDIPITKGTVYVSALILSHLNRIYNWALNKPNVKFVVGGPALELPVNYIMTETWPDNIKLINSSVEQYFKIPELSCDWGLEVPKEIPSEDIIQYAYGLERGCYWGKCKFCYLSERGPEIVRDRENPKWEFLNVDHDKKRIRLGTESITPNYIKKHLNNFPKEKNLNYVLFYSCRKKEYESIKEITRDLSDITFKLGLDFPTKRMWKYMIKGFTPQGSLDSIKLLREKNANIMANIIIGWPNLIEEDITELEEYLNALNIHTKKDLQMVWHTLLVMVNTTLWKEDLKIGKELRSGPFIWGYRPIVKKKSEQINEMCIQVLKQWEKNRQ